MMPLLYRGTKDTPELQFDSQKGIYKISGNSFLDDPFIIYKYVHEWLDEFINEPNPEMKIEFKMNYVNTASSKQIADILIRLEDLQDKCKVKVLWYFNSEDDDMLDEGETLSDMINLDFEFVDY